MISHLLEVSSAGHFVNRQQDLKGNWMVHVVFPDPVRQLKIGVDLVTDMAAYNPYDLFVAESAKHLPFDCPEEVSEDLSIYLEPEPEPAGPKLKAMLKGIETRGDKETTIDFLVRWNMQLQQLVDDIVRLEPGVQTPEGIVTAKRGSCRASSLPGAKPISRVGAGTR